MVAFSQQAAYQVTVAPSEEETVTLAVAFPKFGVLAAIVADPGAIPVTGTLTLAPPAAIATVAGTVATLVLLEFRLTVRPPTGAADDRFRVRFCVVVPLMVTLAGEKLIAEPEPTCTCALANG